MKEEQNIKIAKSMLEDITKQLDEIKWFALRPDDITKGIISSEEGGRIQADAEDMLRDCKIIEKKIGSDPELLAFLNAVKGRIYAIYLELKTFPITRIAHHKKEAIACYEEALRLTSNKEIQGFVRYYLGGLYQVWGEKEKAIENFEQAVNLLGVDDPIGMDAAKKLEKLKEKKGGMCFIATAVYGSSYAPEVLLLKQFRDFHLSKKAIGRCLIRNYYKISPFIAEIIKRNAILRKMIKLLIITPTIKIIKKHFQKTTKSRI
ncbi:hypothetical protein NLC82_04310 [Candidatus Aminicenantes bacterium AC-335-A11]|jgi:tetratricopeptide (TPR) repeat protein|nr:hypothetical protein [SCandidatus Aminicenantes bacterium Aminicenantia_JdfR_composite]MCP2606373.1 hypothetical protein [Candidatus Aminicenantes bacterium AC-708-I09]MCP2618625.1 hypothetical protein [Candidatus Aminicenantes bacterium AC-335-A11]MCP2620974.1 hypothetical protein [Candidatus Aminicenantes bacterium AC-334-E05]